MSDARRFEFHLTSHTQEDSLPPPPGFERDTLLGQVKFPLLTPSALAGDDDKNE